MKEPGQIAYEASLGFLAVTYNTWSASEPDVKAWYARVEAAVRAAALEEAAKVVTEHYQSLSAEHRILLIDRANAIRALSPSPAAPADK